MQILTAHNHRKQFHLEAWREKGMELRGNSGTAIDEWPSKNWPQVQVGDLSNQCTLGSSSKAQERKWMA